MRLPRRVLGVMAVLALGAGALGVAFGVNATVTESDIINAGAALFVSETGGNLTECLGIPGQGEVWIEVRCGDGDGFRAYFFDERGNRLSQPEEPRT